jgi:hypothetical protein
MRKMLKLVVVVVAAALPPSLVVAADLPGTVVRRGLPAPPPQEVDPGKAWWCLFHPCLRDTRSRPSATSARRNRSQPPLQEVDPRDGWYCLFHPCRRNY